MQPGYSPAPSAPTRLLGPDGVPLSGDVKLVTGNGVGIVRQSSPKGFSFSAQAPYVARTVDAFARDAAAARTLLVAQIDAPILRTLDVYAGTAPVGVSAGNCANVRVAGSVSGAVVLPLTPAGVAEWHLGVQDTSTILAGQSITRAGGLGSVAQGALAYRFRPTTNLTVFAFDVLWGDTGASSPTVRWGIAPANGLVAGQSSLTAAGTSFITDADGNQCSVDMDMSPWVPTSLTPSRVLVQPVTRTGFSLVSGTDYYIVGVGLGLNAFSHYRVNWQVKNPADTLNQLGSISAANTPGGGAGQVFESVSGAGGAAPNNWDTNIDSTLAAGIDFRLYGSILGTPLVGLVTVSQTITGAPPGTTGSDMNIRAQC